MGNSTATNQLFFIPAQKKKSKKKKQQRTLTDGSFCNSGLYSNMVGSRSLFHPKLAPHVRLPSLRLYPRHHALLFSPLWPRHNSACLSSLHSSPLRFALPSIPLSAHPLHPSPPLPSPPPALGVLPGPYYRKLVESIVGAPRFPPTLLTISCIVAGGWPFVEQTPSHAL